MNDLFPTLKDFPGILWEAILKVLRAILLAPWRALRWFCRGLYHRRRALLYIVIALVVIHLTATAITGIMLRNEIARLKSTGYLLTTDQLIPHVPPGEKNAADIYQKAFDARRIAREDEEQLLGLRLSKWTPEITPAARRVVSANSEYYALIAEAARTPNCAFPKDWDANLNMTFPEFAKMREAARMLQMHAALSAADGRMNDALADAGTMLRIADHSELPPTLIGQLVGYAIQAIAVQSLRDSLAVGDPSPAAARALMNQIAAIDEVAPSVRSMKGEIALFGLPFYDLARRPGSKDIIAMISRGMATPAPAAERAAFRTYSTVGRPLLNLDELSYLRDMKDQIDVCALPWPESQRKTAANEKQREIRPTYRIPLRRMLIPVFERAVWSREKTAANLGDGQIALALTIYKSEHGAYPDSLATLEAAGFKLPKDPFGGQPFKYRRDGVGFIVYSIGSDMKDDGGLPPVWDTTEKLSDEQRTYRNEHYDLPFRRPR
jgi:hypothetical protein